MKICVTSDSHLTFPYSFSSGHPMADPMFLAACRGAAEPFQAAVAENMGLYHGGDWFGRPAVYPPELMASSRIFSMAKKIRFYINCGNHEVDYPTIPSVLQSLSGMSGAFVPAHDQPFSVFEHDGYFLYVLPYKKEPVFNEIIRLMKNEKIKQPAILCIHQNVKGVRLGQGVKMKDGLTEEQLCDSCSRFCAIICGHIHAPYFSRKFGVPLIIPGSTLSMDFRDEAVEKSFFIAEFEDGKLKAMARRKIESQIYFRRVKLGDQVNPGNIVRVEADGQDQEFMKYRESLLSAGVIAVLPMGVKGREMPYAVNPEIKKSIPEWLEDYCVEKGIADRPGILAEHERIFDAAANI